MKRMFAAERSFDAQWCDARAVVDRAFAAARRGDTASVNLALTDMRAVMPEGLGGLQRELTSLLRSVRAHPSALAG